MMTVRLIAHTPEPEKVVAAAAKLCYSDAHITDLLDGLDEEKTAKFLTRSPGTASRPSACRASAMCVWMISAM